MNDRNIAVAIQEAFPWMKPEKVPSAVAAVERFLEWRHSLKWWREDRDSPAVLVEYGRDDAGVLVPNADGKWHGIGLDGELHRYFGAVIHGVRLGNPDPYGSETERPYIPRKRIRTTWEERTETLRDVLKTSFPCLSEWEVEFPYLDLATRKIEHVVSLMNGWTIPKTANVDARCSILVSLWGSDLTVLERVDRLCWRSFKVDMEAHGKYTGFWTRGIEILW